MNRSHTKRVDELEAMIARFRQREGYLRALIASALVAQKIRWEARQELEPLLAEIAECELEISQLAITSKE